MQQRVAEGVLVDHASAVAAPVRTHCTATSSEALLKLGRQPGPAGVLRIARIRQSGPALSFVVQRSSKTRLGLRLLTQAKQARAVGLAVWRTFLGTDR
jgi:hypothetical protein